ncbi:hypothetical protein [Gottfriedia acidiceleris]|uniref:hypothetical protein n=1 Tax=Gottfriedia acidiceleris TaxID=371036 RepID=UPI003D260F42
MERTHESETTQSKVYMDDQKVFSPIEDLQKMEGVIPLKRKSFEFGKKPKLIRYLGYFFITFIVLTMLFGLVASFLD